MNAYGAGGLSPDVKTNSYRNPIGERGLDTEVLVYSAKRWDNVSLGPLGKG